MTQQDPEMAIIDALFAIVVGILIKLSGCIWNRIFPYKGEKQNATKETCPNSQ